MSNFGRCGRSFNAEKFNVDIKNLPQELKAFFIDDQVRCWLEDPNWEDKDDIIKFLEKVDNSHPVSAKEFFEIIYTNESRWDSEFDNNLKKLNDYIIYSSPLDYFITYWGFEYGTLKILFSPKTIILWSYYEPDEDEIDSPYYQVGDKKIKDWDIFVEEDIKFTGDNLEDFLLFNKYKGYIIEIVDIKNNKIQSSEKTEWSEPLSETVPSSDNENPTEFSDDDIPY